jgi:hypothetical protein
MTAERRGRAVWGHGDAVVMATATRGTATFKSKQQRALLLAFVGQFIYMATQFQDDGMVGHVARMGGNRRVYRYCIGVDSSGSGAGSCEHYNECICLLKWDFLG